MPNSFSFLIQILKVEVHCSNLSLPLTDNFSLAPKKQHSLSSFSLAPLTRTPFSEYPWPSFFKKLEWSIDIYVCYVSSVNYISTCKIQLCIPGKMYTRVLFFLSSIHLFTKHRHIFLFGHVNRRWWIQGTVSKPDSPENIGTIRKLGRT